MTIKLSMPNGRVWNSNGFVEPSLKDIYQQKYKDVYNQYAGKISIEEFREKLKAIRVEYIALTNTDKIVK